jgi:hypothetical protein
LSRRQCPARAGTGVVRRVDTNCLGTKGYACRPCGGAGFLRRPDLPGIPSDEPIQLDLFDRRMEEELYS